MAPPQSELRHLYVVISHCEEVTEKVLLVNFTTYKPNVGQEELCIIEPGEHPFVVRTTVVNYSDALEPITNDIHTAAATSVIRQMEKITPELLTRIQEGAKASKALPKKFRKYFEKF